MDRALLLKKHFWDEEKHFELEKSKAKPTFNPGKKDVAIELYRKYH